MDTLTTFLTYNKNIFTWCSIAIGLPSALLYCAEIWTILWHKPFHNSFYTLFCVRASTDLVYTFFCYFFVRFSILFPEWFLSLALPNWLISFYMFLAGYTIISDNLAMAFILVNRFTAIARPSTHKNIWRKFMAPVLLIVYGVPMYNIGIFWLKVEVFAEKDDHGQILSVYYAEANNGTTLSNFFGSTTIIALFFLAICIPINVAILRAYKKRGKVQQITVGTTVQQRQQTVNEAAKAREDLIERRLFFFAVITFFGHVLIAFWLITLYLAMMAGNIFLTTLLVSQHSLVMDFGLVELPAWLLLWASSSFRRQFFADFMPNKFYKKIFTITTAHTNTIKPQTAKPQMQISSIPKMNN